MLKKYKQQYYISKNTILINASVSDYQSTDDDDMIEVNLNDSISWD